MNDRYYLVKMLVNSQGQGAPSIDEYLSKDSALIAYHNILAAYHNAPDVMYAVVEILNGNGNCEIMERVFHPIPEPELEEDEQPEE